MEHVEFPDLATWEERRRWFERLEGERGRGGAARVLSEQACALMVDLQAAFCAGAWAATVILAGVIVDSQARTTGASAELRADLAWLRRERNALVHEDRRTPAFTIEDQWTNRRQWELKAKRAVAIALAALYPGGAAEDERASRAGAP